MSHRLGGLLVNISLSLVCGLVTFLMGLLAYEIYHFHASERNQEWHDTNTGFDSQLGWGPVKKRSVDYKDWGSVSSNRFGFRSSEIDENKNHIIFLGDSVTWGYGVDDNETFAAVLEKRLAGNDIRVDNLGVSGYGLGQTYLHFKRNVPNIPNVQHVVLVIYTGNDLLDTRSNVAYGKRKPLFRIQAGELIEPTGEIHKYGLRNLLSISHLYTHLKAKVIKIKRLSQLSAHLDHLIDRVVGDEIMSAHELRLVAYALIKKMKEMSEQMDAEFTIVLSPRIDDFKRPSKDHTFFLELCRAEQYDCLDLLNEIQSDVSEAQELSRLYIDSSHFSAEGNKLAAQLIDEAFFSEESYKA